MFRSRLMLCLATLLLVCLQGFARADTCPAVALPTADEWKTLAGQAWDRGLLWKISKGGHSSWLYGTMHLGKPEWVFPGPKLKSAFAASDTLVMEIDPSDEAQMKGMQDPATWGLAFSALPEPLQAQLLAELRRACLPEQLKDMMSAAMLSVTLTMLEARRIGLDASLGSEMMWLQQARQTGKPVMALESAREQFDLFERLPREDALQMIRQSLALLDSKAVLTQTGRLAQSWASSNAADLAAYEQWCDCVKTAADREFMDRMGPQRNRKMAPKIDAAHSSGKRLFVAVGALHMVGKDGLPELLQKRGYTVERISFAP